MAYGDQFFIASSAIAWRIIISFTKPIASAFEAFHQHFVAPKNRHEILAKPSVMAIGGGLF
jgi:hypothetical protein